MKTDIYLIRHGQSEGNLHDLFLGHTDLDLTPLGKKQAERVASYLENISVDKIYSSDLLRAFHTALPLAEKKGLSILKRKDLREIYAGLWDGLAVSELREKYPESCHIWWHDTGLARPDGGESVEELQKRVLSAVYEIAEENIGKKVCIFTHFTPIYALKTAWSGAPLSEMKNMPKPQNASVTHVLYEKGEFEIAEYAYNGYLGDLASNFFG